jgi:hypothetical protein
MSTGYFIPNVMYEIRHAGFNRVAGVTGDLGLNLVFDTEMRIFTTPTTTFEA